MKFYKQNGVMDCGPACLKMIIRHDGKRQSSARLRQLSGILVGATCAIACGGLADSYQPELKSIRITKVVPTVSTNGKLTGSSIHQIDCYFYGDLRIYRVPTEQDSLVGDTMVPLGYYLDRYFVHHKDSAYGQLFFPERSEYKIRVNIDSEIKTLFLNLQLSTLFEQNKVTLVSRDSISASASIRERFRISGLKDSAKKGTLELLYAHTFDDIPFHLSPYMDSIKRNKVYNYFVDASERYVPETGARIDPLTFRVWMERIGNPDKEMVLKYIAYYTRENLNK